MPTTPWSLYFTHSLRTSSLNWLIPLGKRRGREERRGRRRKRGRK